jgi:hypothetical protein
MSDKIQYDHGNFYGLRNVPECAKDLYGDSWQYQIDDYKKELQACIAARERIENYQVLPVIYDIFWYWQDNPIHIKDGDIFDLPTDFEFKEINCCASDVCDTDGQCEHCREPLTVLRLVPKQES